jgi:DNA-binding MarR family transcriptional regulator
MLTRTQVRLLGELCDAAGPIPFRTLAERAGISPPQTSRAVDVLLNNGLVRSERSDEDRRCWLLTPTGVGREQWAHLAAIAA